jgi:hypothetical protein
MKGIAINSQFKENRKGIVDAFIYSVPLNGSTLTGRAEEDFCPSILFGTHFSTNESDGPAAMQYRSSALTGFTKDAEEIPLETHGKWFSIRTYFLVMRIIFGCTKTVAALGASDIYFYSRQGSLRAKEYGTDVLPNGLINRSYALWVSSICRSSDPSACARTHRNILVVFRRQKEAN